MTGDLAGNWWVMAIRGVVALLLGIMCFFLTGITLVALVALIAAYFLVTGVFAIVAGVRGRSWLLILEGAIALVAAVLTFRWPGITALALVYLVAAWAILTGASELAAAFFLRRIIRNEFFLVVGGVAAVLFGVLLVINPAAGLVTIILLIGVYAIIAGISMLALAFRLRGHHHERGGATRGAPSPLA